VLITRRYKTTIDVQKIDTVKHFTYLGTVITSNSNEMEEIQSRICRENKSYYALLPTLKSITYPSIYQNTIVQNSNTSGINVLQRNMGHDKENRKYNKFIRKENTKKDTWTHQQ
jgi:hypothetical protein